MEGVEAFCTKGCYDRYKKDNSSSTAGLGWHNDGKGGKNDPKNSLNALLRWLMVPGNYNRWKGGTDNRGATKLAISNEIAVIINRGKTMRRPTQSFLTSIAKH